MIQTLLRLLAILVAGLAIVLADGPPPARRAQAGAVFGRLPLYFVENVGQRDARVAYYLEGRRASAYFTAGGVTFVLAGDPASVHRLAAGAERSPRPRWALALDFVGASPRVAPAGREATPATVSYFRGPPDRWRTGLSTYAAVAYADLWPGIDLVYSGTSGRLKYTFVIRPGADPGQIRLAYRGATDLTLTDAGQLRVATPAGDVVDDRPYAYQDTDGGRREVAAGFAPEPGRTAYGFHVGPYDRTRTLVLDPAMFVYAGFVGGSEVDSGYAIAVDGAGSAYVIGDTMSGEDTFPVVAGPDPTYSDADDVFVAKVRADGAGLVYAGYLGGSTTDRGRGIAVDGDGNAYVTGVTYSRENSTDPFPVTVGPDLTHNGFGPDAFVAKVNPDGTALVYCGYLGGAGPDEGLGIAVDGAGAAYVVGKTASDEDTFPVKGGPALVHGGGGNDAFVAKVAVDGTQLDYAGYVGGDFAGTIGNAIAVDGAGSAYVTGVTTDGFRVTVGPDLTFNGSIFGDAFVAKVRADGTGLVYAGYIGGDESDIGYGIAVDADGNAYVAGYTRSTEATFPVLVGPDLTFNGHIDGFVAKVTADGTHLVYSGYVGGSAPRGGETTQGIAVDGAGNAYIAGIVFSDETSFPVVSGPDLTYNGGPAFNDNGPDGFVARVRADGTALDYCGYIGSAGMDAARAIAVDGAGNAYVTGDTNQGEATFPRLVGPDLVANGQIDAFVVKVSFDEGPPASTTSTTVPGEGPSTTSTLPPGTAGREVCGNCLDDDGDGLVDFEDAADCCAGAHALTLRRARLKPRGDTSRLVVSAIVGGAKALDPPAADVFVQLRQAGRELLCARVPAGSFVQKRTVFRFKDPARAVAAARGIDRIILRVKKDGSAKLRVAGKQAAFASPPQGSMAITLGLASPAAGEARCAAVEQRLRGGKKGSLRFP